MLNREEFWKTDAKGVPIKHYGYAEIDFDKVQQNRHLVYKQVVMEELAADFYRHQLLHSGDVRYKQAYYLNAIEALKTITGKVTVDHTDKHGVKIIEIFFDDNDLAWFKDRALNGNILGIDLGVFGFHLKWWLTSLWSKEDKEGLGIGKMFGIMGKSAFALAA